MSERLTGKRESFLQNVADSLLEDSQRNAQAELDVLASTKDLDGPMQSKQPDLLTKAGTEASIYRSASISHRQMAYELEDLASREIPSADITTGSVFALAFFSSKSRYSPAGTLINCFNWVGILIPY